MRILLADDHRIVREGLRWMLSREPDIEIVGEANDGEELLEQLDGYDGPVDIVLLDVRMPGLGGLDVLKRLGGTEPSPGKPAVVILSMHSEPAVVRRAVQLGAAGYLLKNTTRDQLLAALRSVAAGKCFVQTDITGPLLDHVAGRDRLEELPKLTERELEVLALVAAGQANKQIAAELGLSEATIKTHLKAIFVRLHAANRAEAAAKALQLGLIGNP